MRLMGSDPGVRMRLHPREVPSLRRRKALARALESAKAQAKTDKLVREAKEATAYASAKGKAKAGEKAGRGWRAQVAGILRRLTGG